MKLTMSRLAFPTLVLSRSGRRVWSQLCASRWCTEHPC